jgi:hypothetical protein
VQYLLGPRSPARSYPVERERFPAYCLLTYSTLNDEFWACTPARSKGHDRDLDARQVCSAKTANQQRYDGANSRGRREVCSGSVSSRGQHWQ